MRVVVHFFRPSGKWYTDETVEFTDSGGLPHENFSLCLREHFVTTTPLRLKDMIAVCINIPDYCPIMGMWDGYSLKPVIFGRK